MSESRVFCKSLILFGLHYSSCSLGFIVICAAYLKAMDEGLSADEATRRAWAAVENRDVAADFLKFWSSRRKASLYAREKLSEDEKKKR